MSLAYAYEKYQQAVQILATGAGTLQERLAYAAMILIRLRDEHLPEGNLRRIHNEIHEDLTWVEAKGSEGKIEATTHLLDDFEARAIAEHIFELFLKLREIDPLSKRFR